MIGRILKLDPAGQPPDQPDPSRRRRLLFWIASGFGLAVLFSGSVLVMLSALPRPHTQSDYLIAGGLATMVTMLALFGILLFLHFKFPDPFFKRRPK